MQKVIRRTAMAEKQAARRLARRKERSAREEAKTNREQDSFSRKEETNQIKAARQARREDWELGPLAPRRDVGDQKETYGTVSSQRMRGPLLREKELEERLKPVGGRYLNLVAGDRVVLLEGRDKGKIGKIASTDRKRAECTVEGLNMVRNILSPPSLNWVSYVEPELQLHIIANTIPFRWMSLSPNG
jgi:large subunit ribosomal protein L24